MLLPCTDKICIFIGTVEVGEIIYVNTVPVKVSSFANTEEYDDQIENSI